MAILNLSIENYFTVCQIYVLIFHNHTTCTCVLKSCFQWLFSSSVTTIISLYYNSPQNILAQDDRKTILGSSCPRELQNIPSQCMYFHEQFSFSQSNSVIKMQFYYPNTMYFKCFLAIFHYPPISLLVSCLTQDSMLESIVLIIVIKHKSACYRFHAKQIYHSQLLWGMNMKWKGVPRTPSLKSKWEHHKYKIEE